MVRKLMNSWNVVSMLLTIEDVMVKDVIAISAEQTVKYAAEIMSRYGIGCLVVLENDRVVGMVTEGDMLKRVIAVAADPEKTLVRQIMSKPAIMVGPGLALEDAVKLMFEHKIKKLPVVERYGEKGKIVGLVTLTDIARLQPQLIKTLMELFKMKGETPPKSIEKVINYYIV